MEKEPSWAQIFVIAFIHIFGIINVVAFVLGCEAALFSVRPRDNKWDYVCPAYKLGYKFEEWMEK